MKTKYKYTFKSITFYLTQKQMETAQGIELSLCILRYKPGGNICK